MSLIPIVSAFTSSSPSRWRAPQIIEPIRFLGIPVSERYCRYTGVHDKVRATATLCFESYYNKKSLSFLKGFSAESEGFEPPNL